MCPRGAELPSPRSNAIGRWPMLDPFDPNWTRNHITLLGDAATPASIHRQEPARLSKTCMFRTV